ncbi:MAG: hypothetical protein QG587_1151, partial [Chloroflexota bacterium]|nr:hypothetical protein [Chloroflexota bacterium]
MGHPWPLFDLRLRTPRLELRLPTDDDLLALAAVARAGVHDLPGSPFLVPWDELPSPAFERQFLLHWWQVRGNWSPGDWTLGLAVLADGRPIGIQDLMARDFAHSSGGEVHGHRHRSLQFLVQAAQHRVEIAVDLLRVDDGVAPLLALDPEELDVGPGNPGPGTVAERQYADDGRHGRFDRSDHSGRSQALFESAFV